MTFTVYIVNHSNIWMIIDDSFSLHYPLTTDRRSFIIIYQRLCWEGISDWNRQRGRCRTVFPFCGMGSKRLFSHLAILDRFGLAEPGLGLSNTHTHGALKCIEAEAVVEPQKLKGAAKSNILSCYSFSSFIWSRNHRFGDRDRERRGRTSQISLRALGVEAKASVQPR